MSAEEEIPKKPETEAEAIAALRRALQELVLANTRLAEAKDELRRREGELRRANYIAEQANQDFLELLHPGSGSVAHG